MITDTKTLVFQLHDLTQSYTLLLPLQIESKPLKTEEAVSSLAKAPVTTTEMFEQFQVRLINIAIFAYISIDGF